MPQLEEIYADLVDHLEEAEEQGWLGEVAARESTLAAADRSSSRCEPQVAQHRSGMPSKAPAVERSSERTVRGYGHRAFSVLQDLFDAEVHCHAAIMATAQRMGSSGLELRSPRADRSNGHYPVTVTVHA
jgi:hypothetical protein